MRKADILFVAEVIPEGAFDVREDEEEEEPRQLKKVGRKLALGNGLQKPMASASERLPQALRFGAPMGFSPLKRDRKRL